MIGSDRFAKVELGSAAALHDWLAVNHAQPEAVWLVTFRSHLPDRYIPMEAILNALLCFGWTDGLRRKLDADRTMQLVSPRRQQNWARSYRNRAMRLIAEGRMQLPGLATIQAAQQSGSWDRLDHVDALEMPEDLLAALAAAPGAAAYFMAAPPSYRRNVLRWLATAKAPATRQKRLELTATLSAQGSRVPQM